MKFTSALVAVVLAASVSAIALPEADCFHPGQICSKEKRAAIAEADCFHPGQICSKERREAIAEADCFHPGQICSKVKRAAEAFAEALASPDELLDARCESSECFSARVKTRELAGLVALTVRHAEPAAYIESLNLRDESLVLRHAAAFEKKRAAEPDCFHPGQICSKEKREAVPDCFHPGQICSKKRSCGDAGAPCFKLKRAAEALAEAVAEPEPDCFHPGQICSKEKREAVAAANADCFHPGQICSKAKRDAYALAAAANEVLAKYK